MVTFEDLPLEIHYMILEQVLPKLAPHPWSIDVYLNDMAAKPYHTAMLRIATISRSTLTNVHRLISSEEEQERRRKKCAPTALYSDNCRACPVSSGILLRFARRSLERTIDSPIYGTSTPI